MGIKNFNKLLQEQSPNSIKENNIKEYKNKNIVIDTSLVLYKNISALRNTGKDLTDKNGKITSHIFAIIQNSLFFLDRGMKPIFIFDGKAPELKKNTLDDRKKLKKSALDKKDNALTKEEEIKYFKRSLFITKEQYDDCKKVLKILGIPFIQADGEADCLCAYLVKNNYAYAAYSEDMDFLSFGCTKLIKNIKGTKAIEINLEDVLKGFEMDINSFINLTILLGCDYLPTIKGIGYKTAFKIISKHKNIKTFIKDNEKFIIPKNYNYEEVIKYYLNDKIKLNNVNELIKYEKPDFDKFKEFLLKNDFGEKVIDKYIFKLKKKI